jgi:exonuclease SbcD
VAYSGSLQRVDFSEEADDKGFCLVEIDAAAPQGKRLVDFRFEQIAARPFVTVDASIPENEPNPTEFVARVIARHPVAGAIVRLRINLSAEQSAHLRDADLRQELSSAHYVAGMAREVADEARRRLAVEPSDLQPLTALRMYLESRGVSAERRGILLERAEALLASVDTEVEQ